MGPSSERNGSFLLERFDKLGQVARLVSGGCEDVHMVGHYAVGVYKELTNGSMFSELSNQPSSHRWTAAEAAAIVKAQGDEIDSASAIFADRQSYILAA